MANLTVRGLCACYITGDMEDAKVMQDVMQGAYQAVFFTLEMLMGQKKMATDVINPFKVDFFCELKYH